MRSELREGRARRGGAYAAELGALQPRRGGGADFLRKEHLCLLWKHRPPRLTTARGDRTGESGAAGHGGRVVRLGLTAPRGSRA